MIIAIDGPAASGKGTLSRRLARHYGFACLDTGRLYRAVACKLLDSGQNPADSAIADAVARQIGPSDLEGSQLSEDRVSQAASVVAAHPGVRAALLDFQRNFARHPPGGAKGAILDGRDIGTVICPDAEVKLYVTASAETRALRRFKELQGSGAEAIYERVLQDIEQRDARDRGRPTAPLKQAEDALLLDTTALDADAAFKEAVDLVENKLAGKPR